MNNKKFFLMTICVCAGFSLFAKPSKKKAETSENQHVENPTINPEIEKLNKVLLSMTDRCKAAIPNGNPEEFLEDLYRVLEAEKSFPSDDLSLYYLIDKTHKVSADYEPKGLVPLVKNDLYAINKNNLLIALTLCNINFRSTMRCIISVISSCSHVTSKVV